MCSSFANQFGFDTSLQKSVLMCKKERGQSLASSCKMQIKGHGEPSGRQCSQSEFYLCKSGESRSESDTDKADGIKTENERAAEKRVAGSDEIHNFYSWQRG